MTKQTEDLNEQNRLKVARMTYEAYKKLGLSMENSTLSKEDIAYLEKEENDKINQLQQEINDGIKQVYNGTVYYSNYTHDEYVEPNKISPLHKMKSVIESKHTEHEKKKDKEYDAYLKKELYEHSMHASIKHLDFKKDNAVPNKRKKKKYSKTAIVISTTAICAAAAVFSLTYKNVHKNDAYLNNESFVYDHAAFGPNMKINTPTYNEETGEWKEGSRYYNAEKIVKKTREIYEDPVIGFYFLCDNIDPYTKKNHFTLFLDKFNLEYGTNYSSVKDFLMQNNFKNEKEWKEYVVDTLKEMEVDRDGAGDSNLGR